MFRIRRIFDDVLRRDDDAIAQVKEILRDQFNRIPPEEVEELGEKLRNPIAYRLRRIIHVAEDQHHSVRGFSIVAHAPDLKFCLLDSIATASGLSGGGTGGGVVGLFFECLPDDPAICPDPPLLQQNAARLRFYKTPLKPGSTSAWTRPAPSHLL